MRRDTKTTQRGRVLELVLSLVLAVASQGCLSGALSPGNAAQPHLDTKVFPVSCDDGRRYAARTLKARSYKITGVERGASQTTVSGHNEGENVDGSVTVTCRGDGVTVAADGPTLWVRDGLRFGFNQIAETGDKVWPPPKGPVVKMTLYEGAEAKIEFPSELEPLGVVALRVKVLNAGDRTFKIDPRRLLATTASGSQVRPIAQTDARAKLAGADPEIDKKLLKPTTLKKGESVIGFVFFPVADYENAAIALIDEKTGEADDYDVYLSGIS